MGFPLKFIAGFILQFWKDYPKRFAFQICLQGITTGIRPGFPPGVPPVILPSTKKRKLAVVPALIILKLVVFCSNFEEPSTLSNRTIAITSRILTTQNVCHHIRSITISDSVTLQVSLLRELQFIDLFMSFTKDLQSHQMFTHRTWLGMTPSKSWFHNIHPHRGRSPSV